MPRGGDFGGRRPRSPAVTLRNVEALAAQIKASPQQIAGWTEDELTAVVKALTAAGFAFQDELERRWARQAEEE